MRGLPAVLLCFAITSGMPCVADAQRDAAMSAMRGLAAKEAKETNPLSVDEMHSPLMDAVRGNSLGKVRRLLKKGASVDEKTPEGHTALALAAYLGRAKIAEELLKNGAQVNAVSNDLVTPLHLAAFSGNRDVVQLLLAKGADSNALTSGGRTPLMACINGEQYTRVTDMMRNAERTGSFFMPPANPKFARVLECLLNGGADPNLSAANGSNAVHLAAKALARNDLLVFLKRGADVNRLDADGVPLIGIAVRLGDKDGVKILLEHGASLNARTRYGATLLHIAVNASQWEMLEYLISTGRIDIDAKDDDGLTALHVATKQAVLSQCMEILLTNGASVDPLDNKRETPLVKAAINNNFFAAKNLLEHGANPDAVDAQGRTLLFLSSKNWHPEWWTTLLASHGAK